MKRTFFTSLACIVLLPVLVACSDGSASTPAEKTSEADKQPVALALQDTWSLNSGCAIKDKGAAISTAGYQSSSWTRIAVPATVLAAQIAAGQFKDPFFGKNLRSIPGTTYPIGKNFSILPMSKDSPYACAWWYRKSFQIPQSQQGRQLWLRFDGINYRANIWLNGKQIARSDDVAGAFRRYELNITPEALVGQENVLAVETFAPTERDLGITWVDWNPSPPDKNMGLTGAVSLDSSGAVKLRSPLVTTSFSGASLDQAKLTVYGDLKNATKQVARGTVTAELLGFQLTQTYELAPGETKTIVFAPEKYQQLKVSNPQLWWPYQMGKPQLNSIIMRVSVDGVQSDQRSERFGIREITSELTDKGHRLFRVNGKPILIRGGGWSQDMLLRTDSRRLAQQFELTRDLHLNTIRLEGRLETDEFYRLADEQGILVIAGWSCCDQWEQWDSWTPENHTVAEASIRSQMLYLRHHASLLAWFNGSDNPPPAAVEKMYLKAEKELHWPNPVLSSATSTPTSVSGNSGVKMNGPYDFVAPSYWLVDTERFGGAFGFNTETSPGPAIPSEYSLRKFLPETSTWPPDETWNYHNGGNEFSNTSVFDDAMKASYGTPNSLNEYQKYAQAMAYDGERAMFEAHSANKYTATGVIQWMLNNAWPSMIWHLYDYYLDAAGGYYGARKACEPLHVQYSYGSHNIVVVNSEYVPLAGLHVQADVYDLQLKQVFSRNVPLDVGADSATQAFSIPAEIFTAGNQLHFVKLALLDAQGTRISENFYWVPSKLTVFDWDKTDFTHTPAASYEDLGALKKLPPAQIAAEIVGAATDGVAGVTVRVRNTSQALAFQLSLKALDSQGQAIAPAFWSDNYISLMPGETRILSVRLSAYAEQKEAIAAIALSGWNVPDKVVARP